MTPKVFDKLYPLVLFLLPEFDMAVLTGRDNEVCPEKRGFDFDQKQKPCEALWGKFVMLGFMNKTYLTFTLPLYVCYCEDILMFQISLS